MVFARNALASGPGNARNSMFQKTIWKFAFGPKRKE
jgi:hypothetical protein